MYLWKKNKKKNKKSNDIKNNNINNNRNKISIDNFIDDEKFYWYDISNFPSFEELKLKYIEVILNDKEF